MSSSYERKFEEFREKMVEVGYSGEEVTLLCIGYNQGLMDAEATLAEVLYELENGKERLLTAMELLQEKGGK